MIVLNGKTPSEVRLGDQAVKAIYRGEEIVYKRVPSYKRVLCILTSEQVYDGTSSEGSAINAGISLTTESTLKEESTVKFYGEARETSFITGFNYGACRYWGVTGDLTAFTMGSADLHPEGNPLSINDISCTFDKNKQSVTLCTSTDSKTRKTSVNKPYDDYKLGSVSKSEYRPFIMYYGTRIYVDDVLVRDYVPCIDNDGKAVYYDKLNGVPYYSMSATPITYRSYETYMKTPTLGYYLDRNVSKLVYSTVKRRSIVFPCESGKYYTVSNNIKSTKKIAFIDSLTSENLVGGIESVTGKSITNTTPAPVGAKYCVVQIASSGYIKDEDDDSAGTHLWDEFVDGLTITET